MNVNIQSIFRCDRKNIGDLLCPPFHYFNFGSRSFIDILQVTNVGSLSSSLVIGGGGLLANPTFETSMNRLFERTYHTVIGWGLGHDAHGNLMTNYAKRTKFAYPAYMERFNLVGVRDYGTRYPWVPCASCLHPLFQKRRPIQNEIVVYEHRSIPIAIDCFPKMTNNTMDIKKVMDFLGSSRVVITNSYHGAYWSQLMGKAVLAFPFSSKFYRFKHKITLCKPAEWKKWLDRVEEQPSALQECIAVNLKFWQKVKNALGI